MSEKPAEKPALKPGSHSGAESPTTARELDFDDEPQEHQTAHNESAPPAKPRVTFQEEVPPPKPPRPLSPHAHAEATLIEAFPDMDVKVIKAVLVASQGRVEPAFTALLSMSDPNFKQEEEIPPPRPPRPHQPPRNQVESDELYARQLAQHYEMREGYGSRMQGEPPMPQRRKETGLKPNELYDDREHSFFDDDLPVIKENFQKGFAETQTKFNNWINDLRKKFDGEDEDEINPQRGGLNQRQDFGPSQSQQLYGIRKSAEMGRRSGDRDRYDADPRVLSDDFTTLELRDNDSQPQRPPRPLANPDLFKPTPIPPQQGPVDEVEAARQQSASANQSSSAAAKTKKWQPLTSVAPNPEVEDHDPFSLGDSDDEESKTKDIKAEDTARLKKAASESTKAPPIGGDTLQPAQLSGTKDKEAEEALTAKK